MQQKKIHLLLLETHFAASGIKNKFRLQKYAFIPKSYSGFRIVLYLFYTILHISMLSYECEVELTSLVKQVIQQVEYSRIGAVSHVEEIPKFDQ